MTTLRTTLRPLAALLAGALLALLVAAPAGAASFPGEVVDGPASDIQAFGDLDVARDGSGALVYTKGDHVFVSRLTDGAFATPEQVDTGLGPASSQPVVGTADKGRVAIAFVNAGSLYTVLATATGQPFTSPQLLVAGSPPAATLLGAPPATPLSGVVNPSLDMSYFGVGVLTFTAPGGGGADVRAARLPLNSTTWQLFDGALDNAPGSVAGIGTGRSRVAASADGSGVAVWGEDGAVFSRRILRTGRGEVVAQASTPALEGRAAGPAESPDVAVEDDSSFAWVVMRQSFDNGGALVDRAIAHRLVGSAYEPPVSIDGQTFPVSEGSDRPRIALAGKGAGFATASRESSGFFTGAVLKDDAFLPGTPLNAGPSASLIQSAPAVAQNGDGISAWIQDAGGDQRSVNARPFANDGTFGTEITLSRPEFGSVIGGAIDASLDRANDSVVGFAQNGSDGKRIVVGVFDQPPGKPRGLTKFLTTSQPVIRWTDAFDLWGPPSYRVDLDGQPLTTTTALSYTPPTPLPDGNHLYRVVAIDRRGQTAVGPSRQLKIDATPPTLVLRVSGARRHGGTTIIRIKARDATSGVKTVVLRFGDGTTLTAGRAKRVTHRFAKSGKYTVTATAIDAAGNRTVAKLPLSIH